MGLNTIRTTCKNCKSKNIEYISTRSNSKLWVLNFIPIFIAIIFSSTSMMTIAMSPILIIVGLIMFIFNVILAMTNGTEEIKIICRDCGHIEKWKE